MIGNNFYKDLSITQAASEAFMQSKDILLGILKIPVQLFPMDKEEAEPDQTTKGHRLKSWICKFIFFIAVISIVVGFINLILYRISMAGQLILLAAEKHK